MYKCMNEFMITASKELADARWQALHIPCTTFVFSDIFPMDMICFLEILFVFKRFFHFFDFTKSQNKTKIQWGLNGILTECILPARVGKLSSYPFDFRFNVSRHEDINESSTRTTTSHSRISKQSCW
jgi:hypothetical protein